MDKKQAEEDAVKKAKENAHAAGKNTGMSGRDLVRLALHPHSLSLSSPSPLPALDRELNLIAPFPQFTFNPEWFEDSEEEEEEDWDLDRYRKQKEEEDEATEAERIRQLQVQDSGGE
jgi:hypothetical protein